VNSCDIGADTWLTFDDVLILPRLSDVLPSEVSLSTGLTANISLGVPIISSPMDTVTEHKMAIVMAKLGGIGVIHKNMTAEKQAHEVRLVKNHFKWRVDNPLTLEPHMSIDRAVALLTEHRCSGAPVVQGGKLVGVLTSRDIDCAQHGHALVSDIMSRDNLITASPDITYEEAMRVLGTNRIERLVVVDQNYHCVGIVTMRDLKRCKAHGKSTVCKNNMLRVAAAVGVSGEIERKRATALYEAGVDAIVVDTAHGHSVRVRDMLLWLKSNFPNLDVIAGNVATPEAALYLAEAGADAVKVGIGPGSICTTRIVAGVGAPQLSAVMHVSRAVRQKFGDNIKIIADGGIRSSGDAAKALAAGADCVMLGSMLAGTNESPGSIVVYKGRPHKAYRGMGSIGAMTAGSADRYGQAGSTKMVAEGVEGIVPFKGEVRDVISRIAGGMCSAFGYTGNATVAEMQRNCDFVRITAAGLYESHPHDVHVTQEDMS
jgi:IMP dehydrogenase